MTVWAIKTGHGHVVFVDGKEVFVHTMSTNEDEALKAGVRYTEMEFSGVSYTELSQMKPMMEALEQVIEG